MATITFEMLKQDIYKLKMDIAYNKKNDDVLQECDIMCEALVDVINDELGTGWFHYTSEAYKTLQEMKSELGLLNRRIYANRCVNKYSIEWLQKTSTELYESL